MNPIEFIKNCKGFEELKTICKNEIPKETSNINAIYIIGRNLSKVSTPLHIISNNLYSHMYQMNTENDIQRLEEYKREDERLLKVISEVDIVMNECSDIYGANCSNEQIGFYTPDDEYEYALKELEQKYNEVYKLVNEYVKTIY